MKSSGSRSYFLGWGQAEASNDVPDATSDSSEAELFSLVEQKAPRVSLRGPVTS